MDVPLSVAIEEVVLPVAGILADGEIDRGGENTAMGAVSCARGVASVGG